MNPTTSNIIRIKPIITSITNPNAEMIKSTKSIIIGDTTNKNAVMSDTQPIEAITTSNEFVSFGLGKSSENCFAELVLENFFDLPAM